VLSVSEYLKTADMDARRESKTGFIYRACGFRAGSAGSPAVWAFIRAASAQQLESLPSITTAGTERTPKFPWARAATLEQLPNAAANDKGRYRQHP